jgi:putative DNA primase/helicase
MLTQYFQSSSFNRRDIVSNIRQALAFIPADNRDTWIMCGMALKAELSESGFELWDMWSATSDKYRARDAAAVWRSFTQSGGVEIGTLFYIAQKYGYRCDSNYKPLSPTPAELARRETKRKTDAELLDSQQAAAAKKAESIWNKRQSLTDISEPTIAHRYLKIKGITAHGAGIYQGNMTIGGMDCHNALMIPMRLNGRITSLQFINGEGEKRFLPYGEKGGYLVGKIERGKPICVCEGFATGASIHEATSYPVVVAFDAGNLKKVAKALRAKYPDSDIVVCGDDDSTGAGQRKATEAAQAIGGRLALPEFTEPRGGGCKDFNDMFILLGDEDNAAADSVKAVIDCARPITANVNTMHLRIVGSSTESATPTLMEKPEPLPELPEVLPFKYAHLPTPLADIVQDISERMQCPPDFAAVGALVMMGSVIGRQVGIRPKREDDWTVIPNLWGVVIGHSGVMKSPTLAAVLSPIKKLQAAAYEDYEQAVAAYEEQAEHSKLKRSVKKTQARKALKNNEAADVSNLLKSTADNMPIQKRYVTNNASYEALGELLMENPNGLLVESDEIIGLIKQLDASGQEVARSFYLTAADGDKPYTFDRITRGKGLHIEALCLSIIGGVQPGVLAEYVRQATNGGPGADGLLQRFGLMVYPDISPKWTGVDREPDGAARKAINELVQELDNLGVSEIEAEADELGGVPFLHFDDDAQRAFSEWQSKLEHRLRSGEDHPAIVSHLSKYRKLIPSLALINHLCNGGKGPVSELALQRAIEFSEYLEAHMQRVYSYATRPDIDAAKTLLKRLATGKLQTPFKARDLYQKGWTGLETLSKAQAAINLLLEYRHLHEEEIATGGRPTTRYYWITVTD